MSWSISMKRHKTDLHIPQSESTPIAGHTAIRIVFFLHQWNAKDRFLFSERWKQNVTGLPHWCKYSIYIKRGCLQEWHYKGLNASLLQIHRILHCFTVNSCISEPVYTCRKLCALYWLDAQMKAAEFLEYLPVMSCGN